MRASASDLTRCVASKFVRVIRVVARIQHLVMSQTNGQLGIAPSPVL
jgi:hypothetical protein